MKAFPLADLVSYDRKHNEANGEDNQDGNPYNASWNCGVEGPTRKRTILQLRKRQMKTHWHFCCCRRGTPMLTAGGRVWTEPGGQQQSVLSGTTRSAG